MSQAARLSTVACENSRPLGPGAKKDVYFRRLCMVDLGEGPGGPPLFWVKQKKSQKKEKNKRQGKQNKTTPTPLNSRSGSATGQLSRDTGLELIILLLN